MINGINSREMILEILLEIEEGEHSHVAIRNALSKYQFLPKQDRAFITRVCEGTLEYRIQIDYIINSFSIHPQGAVRHPVARRGQPSAGQRPAGGGKQPDPLHTGDLHGQPRRGRGPVRQLKGYGAPAAVFPVFGAGGAVRPADARDHPRPHKGRHRRHAPPDFYDAAHDRRVLAGGGGRVCAARRAAGRVRLPGCQGWAVCAAFGLRRAVHVSGEYGGRRVKGSGGAACNIPIFAV